MLTGGPLRRRRASTIMELSGWQSGFRAQPPVCNKQAQPPASPVYYTRLRGVGGAQQDEHLHRGDGTPNEEP